MSGEITLSKLFCHPSEKESTLKGKQMSPLGSNFFPIRVKDGGGGQILSFNPYKLSVP